MICICGKKFKSIVPYQNHRVLCEARAFSLNKNNANTDETPSTNEMWKIIMALVNKTDKQDKKIKKLQQALYKKNKKIDIINILDSNFTPRYDYKKFIENMVFTDEDLKMIFNTNLITGMTNIINAKFLEKNIITIPIQYFKEKKGVMYIYSIGRWREKEVNFGLKIVGNIYDKLLEYYTVYNKNRSSNTVDDKFEEIEKLIISKEDKNNIYKKIHFNVKKELESCVVNFE